MESYLVISSRPQNKNSLTNAALRFLKISNLNLKITTLIFGNEVNLFQWSFLLT